VNFDPDSAGRAATRRSLEVLLENGFEVNVVALPAGKDPDLFVREQGVVAYRGRLQAGLPYIEFLTRDTAARHDLSGTRGKVAALNEVLPFLARLDNPVRRAGHVEMIATVLGIEDRLVLQELKDAVRERRKGVKAEALTVARGGFIVSEAESRLLRSVMDSEDVRRTVLDEMEAGDMETCRIAEVMGVVRDLVVKGENVNYPRVASLVSDDARDILTRVAALPHPPATLEEGRACLMALRAARLQRQMGDIQKRLQSAGKAEETDDLLRLKIELKRRIEALPKASPLS